MRKVFHAINVGSSPISGEFDLRWETAISEKVWEIYFRERAEGDLKFKFLFFTIDAAPFIGKKLIEWFGPDPKGGVV